MSRAGRPWTRKETAFLEQNASRMTILAISQELERTEASIERKVKELRIPRLARERVLNRPYREPTEAELHHANRLHVGDLKRAGHTWWHKLPPEEVDVLPTRVSTFTHSSCTGSPAAMCVE